MAARFRDTRGLSVHARERSLARGTGGGARRGRSRDLDAMAKGPLADVRAPRPLDGERCPRCHRRAPWSECGLCGDRTQ